VSRDSSAGIATDYGLDGKGLIPGRGKICLSIPPRSALRPSQVPIHGQQVALSLEVKRSGREADHSLPCSADVNNSGAIAPLPLTYSWCGAYLIKHMRYLILPCLICINCVSGDYPPAHLFI
jgi:hypothetical protein